MRKKLLALAAVCALTAGLTACGGVNKSQISTLVKGEIDATYLGQYNSDFMKLIDATEDDLQEDYNENIDAEAEFFCTYFGIVNSDQDETYDDSVSDETKEKLRDLIRDIYSHTKYSLGDVVASDDGNFSVEVTVSPINVIELATDAIDSDGDNPYSAFMEESADLDFESMTDEDYFSYTQNYAQACISLVEDQMNDLGYDDDEEVTIRVEKDESDGLYVVNSDDFSDLDAVVIAYP